MRSGFIKFVGMVYALAALGSPLTPAQAANINVSASQCQPDIGAADPAPPMVVFGVGSVWNYGTTRATVVCNVTRSPLVSTATVGGFYVDGDNPTVNGVVQTTQCNLVSTDYTGRDLGFASFSNSSPKYDVFLTLPAAQLTMFAYTSLICGLPPNGVLRGVTSIQ